MKKGASLSAILLTLAIFAFAGAVSAATITVCPSGCDYTLIGNATANAEAGDVINVSAGTYDSETFPILVNKTLTIQSASGAAGTIINANSSSHGALNITADDVAIIGFTVKGGGNSTVYEHVIDINANSATIQDNILVGYSGNTADIHVSHGKGDGHAIKGNTLRHKNAGEGWGIQAENLTQSLIEDNLCYGDAQWSADNVEGAPGTCIEIGDADTVTVKGNIAYNLKYSFLTFVGEYPKPDETGYMYKDCRDVSIANVNVLNNTVYNISKSWQKAVNFKPCGQGGQPGGWTDHGNLTIGFNVTVGPDNTFYDISGADCAAVVIDENSEEDDGIGYMFGVSNINISYNRMYDNTYGVWNGQSETANAAYNWWGSSTGPGGVGPGTGDNITANVEYQPYCRNIECTAFGIETKPAGFPGSGTTNFSLVSDYSDVALVLDNGVNVAVNFSSGVDLTGSTLEFSAHVSMATGYVSIDSAGMPELNAPATIRFEGLNSQTTPVIYRDGNVCPSSVCSGVSYNSNTGVLTFTVTGFSTYYVSSGLSIGVDRLNYWEQENHTISMGWTGGGLANLSALIPSGWEFISGSGCTNISQAVICNNVTNGSEVSFVMQVINASAHPEFEISSVEINATSGGSSFFSPDLRIIRVQDHNIFHTLVEYGRGRGNYFFDSYAAGTAGSGHTGVGCSYIPSDTMLELNFLHKVVNIKQKFMLASSTAEEATFTCTYPDNNIVRIHLAEEMTDLGSLVQVDYAIPEIEGSWERMGYVGINFAASSYGVNENITINCTNITYSLPGAYGDVIVDEDSFTLEFRNKYPFTVSASGLGIIGNGSQEMEITYNITNSEQYTVNDVIIEISAPQYATFIGVRGELWGTSLEKYRLERIEFAPGETEQVTLVARFNTSGAPQNMTELPLSGGISIEYVTCWEANSYNPSRYVQYLTAVGNGTANMSLSTEIVNLIERILRIELIVTEINRTVYEIDSTLLEFYYYMNNTVWGNLTAQDLLDKMQNSTNGTGDILTQISYLRQFNDELAFLVTDSFNSQKEARSFLQSGDVGSAARSLEDAKDKLQQAAGILQSEQATLQKKMSGSRSKWVWIIPTLAFIAMLVLYLSEKEVVVIEEKAPPKKEKKDSKKEAGQRRKTKNSRQE